MGLGELPPALNLGLLLAALENSVAGSPEASGQGELSLNPPCVPNLPLKSFKFQADNLNLSPYKANPLLLNVGKNLLLSLLW